MCDEVTVYELDVFPKKTLSLLGLDLGLPSFQTISVAQTTSPMAAHYSMKSKLRSEEGPLAWLVLWPLNMGRDSMRLFFSPRAKKACQVYSAAATRQYHCSMVNRKDHHILMGAAIL